MPMHSILQCTEYRPFLVQAKQAYLKDMSVYGINLATYQNFQKRYTALLADYNKVSARSSLITQAYTLKQ